MVARTNLKPLLKWAGGKEKELKYIVPCLPESFNRYFEPFVGGGSIYMSFKARHYFINDKSDELIFLYRSIQTGNPVFYQFVAEIISAWNTMEKHFQHHLDLIETYKAFRSGILTNEELKSSVEEYLRKADKAIRQIVPKSIPFDRIILIKEIKLNLIRKLIRMKVIEVEKHILSDADLYRNIETALKGSLYMCFRRLYNKKELANDSPELHSALFLFIRNYAYSGMFRYNKNGEFNVPYGGIGYNSKTLKKKLDYYQSAPLLKHMQQTTIDNLDFEAFLNRHNPAKDDFIFLDPPYDSEFSTYSQNSFAEAEHRRLADCLLRSRAKWMMVIKNTPLISSLYFDKGLNIHSFDKKYLVSFMNRNDKNAEHLIITNYQEPPNSR